MIWLLAHIAGYATFASSAAQAARKYLAARKRSSRHELLLRITALEHELGLGIDWALDRIGGFSPVLSRPKLLGYSSLHQYAFRCYGCQATVIYADYDQRPMKVRDKRHLLCDKCFPKEAAA